jgi:hypothetical protein
VNRVFPIPASPKMSVRFPWRSPTRSFFIESYHSCKLEREQHKSSNNRSWNGTHCEGHPEELHGSRTPKERSEKKA